MIIDILIGLAICAAGAFLLRHWYRKLPESAKWDLAASTMQMEGYTDLDICKELGPRPKD